MMSEKRFELTKINPTVNLSDTVYFIIDYENPNKEIRTLKDCVDLLNEQQATINKVCELLEEEDIFSDEATEHDINAYIELQKFDNKDAYYLACGIKKAIKLLKGDDV